MNENIFNKLFEKLSEDTKRKGNLLNHIQGTIGGINEIKSLFGEKKIEELMVSPEAVKDLQKPLNIIKVLLGYKYRLTHNGHSNSKYNMFNDAETQQQLEVVDSSVDFILNILLANNEYLKKDVNYGNALVQMSLNECLSENSYNAIQRVASQLKTDKELLESIYWLNMPIRGLCGKTITKKMSDSWTLEDLLCVKHLDIDEFKGYFGEINKKLMSLVEKSDLLNHNEQEIKPNLKHGAVFYELLEMKLETEKMPLSYIAYFMLNCLQSTLFNSRSPEVCELAQSLVSKMKSHLNEEELDALDELYRKDKNYNSFTINSSIFFSPNNDFISLIPPRVPLVEDDFISLLLDKNILAFGEAKDFIKDWALEVVMEKEIPSNKPIKEKPVKF